MSRDILTTEFKTVEFLVFFCVRVMGLTVNLGKMYQGLADVNECWKNFIVREKVEAKNLLEKALLLFI